MGQSNQRRRWESDIRSSVEPSQPFFNKFSPTCYLDFDTSHQILEAIRGDFQRASLGGGCCDGRASLDFLASVR